MVGVQRSRLGSRAGLTRQAPLKTRASRDAPGQIHVQGLPLAKRGRISGSPALSPGRPRAQESPSGTFRVGPRVQKPPRQNTGVPAQGRGRAPTIKRTPAHPQVQ